MILWRAFVEAALGTGALALTIGGPIAVYEWRRRCRRAGS